jgi:hypothetical protein
VALPPAGIRAPFAAGGGRTQPGRAADWLPVACAAFQAYRSEPKVPLFDTELNGGLLLAYAGSLWWEAAALLQQEGLAGLAPEAQWRELERRGMHTRMQVLLTLVHTHLHGPSRGELAAITRRHAESCTPAKLAGMPLYAAPPGWLLAIALTTAMLWQNAGWRMSVKVRRSGNWDCLLGWPAPLRVPQQPLRCSALQRTACSPSRHMQLQTAQAHALQLAGRDCSLLLYGEVRRHLDMSGAVSAEDVMHCLPTAVEIAGFRSNMQQLQEVSTSYRPGRGPCHGWNAPPPGGGGLMPSGVRGSEFAALLL